MLKGKTAAREYVPEDDIWLRNGRIGREEGNDSMGIGGSNGGEEGGGVEGASIEKVGGFYKVVSHIHKVTMDRDARVRVRTSTRFESEGTKLEDLSGNT